MFVFRKLNFFGCKKTRKNITITKLLRLLSRNIFRNYFKTKILNKIVRYTTKYKEHLFLARFYDCTQVLALK